MPSPFPGMDPYLEQSKLWVDFHNRLADEISAQLNAKIRPDYFARLTPYTTYEVVGISQVQRRSVRPDVGVMMRERAPWATAPSAVIEKAPVESMVENEAQVDLMSVEIYRTHDEVLVTAIEILSPANKQPGHKQPGHEAYTDYLSKRRELFRSDVHLMEIDLLRGGTRPPLYQPVPAAPYYVVLSRANQRPYVSVWPLQLQAKLPVLPAPLLPPDPDAPLELDKAFAAVYERGGYDVQIDYTQPVPPPALSDEENRWVDELLAPFRMRESYE
jgi:hypothetical protein